MHQARKTLHQEPCPGHEHERDPNFPHDEHGAEAPPAAGFGGAAAAFLQCFMEILFGCLERGHESENNSSDRAEKKGEDQNNRVDFHFGETGHRAGTDRTHRGKTRGSEKNSARAPTHREKNTFAQQLTHEPTPRSAKSFSHGDFPFAGRSTRKKKIGDISATNQKNEPNSRKQHKQRRTEIAHKASFKRLRKETKFCGVHIDPELFFGVRVDGVEFRLCARESLLRTQPRDDVQKSRASLNLGGRQLEYFRRTRQPHIRLRILDRKTKSSRKDSDNRCVFPIEHERFPQRRGIRREMATPETVREHSDVGPSELFFFRKESSSLRRRNSQNAE